MAITITEDLFNYVDSMVSSFVSTNVSQVASTLAPAISVALSLSYMLEGLFLIVRPNGEPFSSLINRFIHSAIIVGIASAGGLYQSTLANAALKAPDEFSSVLIISNSGTGTTSTAVGSTIDQALTSGVNTATTALENAGVMSGAGLANLVVAFCAIVSTAIMCGLGAGLIFMAKLMLGIVVSLGPLFIFMLLFQSTRAFFERWVSQVVTYGLTVVLMSAAFGLMIYFFNNLTQGFANNPNAAVLSGVICAIVLTIVTWFVMKEVPNVAAGLAGGVAVQSIGHTMASFAAGAASRQMSQHKQSKMENARNDKLIDAIKGGKGGGAKA
jgi:type IV secretion system protein VirB6